jgi:hypothetical protein
MYSQCDREKSNNEAAWALDFESTYLPVDLLIGILHGIAGTHSTLIGAYASFSFFACIR